MIKLYRYLFYRLYLLRKKNNPKDDLAYISALYGVSFMMFVNLSLLGPLLEVLGVIKFFREKPPKIEIISIGLILFIYSYFKFAHKKKYLKILEEYKNETKRQRLIRGLLLWLYVILSFVMVFVEVKILEKLNLL